MSFRRPPVAVLLTLLTVLGSLALAAPAACGGGATACLPTPPDAEIARLRHAGVDVLRFEDASGGGAFVSRDGGRSWSGPFPGPGGIAASFPRDAASLAAARPHAVLQLATPMLPEWKAALDARGVAVHAYYPSNAFLVTLPPGADVAGLPFVAAVAALPAWAKLDAGLPREGRALAHVLLVPDDAGALREAVAAVEASGGRVTLADADLDRLTVDVPAQAAAALAELPGVLWVGAHSDDAGLDMNVVREMTGPAHLATAPRDVRGQGIVGEVLDGGIDAQHPDFQGALLAVRGTNEPQGHGTSTFGIVFGRGALNPVAAGMATGAQGVFVAAAGASPPRYATAVDLRDNFSGHFQSYSISDGGPRANSYSSHSQENDRIVFDLGLAVFRSMGNVVTESNHQIARNEAMAKNVIAVGGIAHRDTASELDDAWDGGAGVGAAGPAKDGRHKPDMSAHFDLVFTTAAANERHVGQIPNPYGNFGGTSAATPIVAGAGALAMQLYKENRFGGNALGAHPTPAMTKALLVSSADPRLPSQTDSLHYPYAPGETTRHRQGWGFPDLQLLDQYAADTRAWNASGLSTGGTATFTIDVPAERNLLAVTLAWTDPPATPVSDPTVPVLVNDLDLEVSNADGTRVYRGNVGLATARFSSTGGDWDRLNNLENVFVNVPTAGTWTITVRAHAVNLDGDASTGAVDQPFALVARAANERPTV